MASGKTIKGITVEIGGSTTGLGKALSEANAKLKDTQSELNKVDKALKLDPNNVTLVKQKQELLTKAISDTSSKLDTLKKSQKQVEDQFKSGKIGEEAYRDFQRELETTKAKLENLKDEKKSINVISTAFKSAKSHTAELTKAIGKVSSVTAKAVKSVGELAAKSAEIGGKTVISGINAAEKGLKAYSAAAGGAATALVGVTAKAGLAADDINTLSAQTGLSTEQIQKFQYASDIIDVDIETLTGSMAKLTKNMENAKDGSGTAADAFSALGISVTDSNGELRSNQDVFDEAIAALGEMENETQRDAYAMQIFGKSAQDLNPLIKGGADTLKELGDSAQDTGMILSQDALNNLNGFNDSVDILKANASASSKIIGGTFAGSFTTVTDRIGQSLPQLATSFSGMFSPETFELAQTNFSTHFAALAVNITDNVAANLPTFLNGFNGFILGVVNGIVTSLPTMIHTILPTLITGFTDLVTGLVQYVPTVLPLLVEGGITLFTGLLDSLNQIVELLMPQLPEIVKKISEMLVENLPTIIEGGMQLLIGLIDGITECIPDLIQCVLGLIPVITDTLVENLPQLIKAGMDLITALAKGLPDAIPAIIAALPEIIKAIIDGFAEVDWLEIGINILEGIAKGLIEAVKGIGSVIADVGSSIKDGFCSFFGINSPSRLFRDTIGKNLAAGIGVGFEDEMTDVNAAMQAAVPTSFDTDVNINRNLSNSGSALGFSAANSLPQTASFYIIMDGQTVANKTAPFLDILNGAKVSFSDRGLST